MCILLLYHKGSAFHLMASYLIKVGQVERLFNIGTIFFFAKKVQTYKCNDHLVLNLNELRRNLNTIVIHNSNTDFSNNSNILIFKVIVM